MFGNLVEKIFKQKHLKIEKILAAFFKEKKTHF
jgi:hypothetical protein